MKRIGLLIAALFLISGCAATTSRVPLRASSPIPATGLSGSQFRAAIDQRLNGSQEIDPLLGTGTLLWGLALSAVPANGFCLGPVAGLWGSLTCLVSGGAAGGDLGGTWPNPTVVSGVHLAGGTVPNSALATTPITACSGDINAGCSQVTSGAHLGAGTVPQAAEANSGVTAGSYTNPNLTVAGNGSITAASNGPVPVTNVIGSAPIVSSGGATPALSLGNLSPFTAVAVGGATTLVLPASPLDPIQTLTFSASATVTIPQGNFAGQALAVFVCQNGTGGFTPTFVPIAGLTIVGTFPTFTTTASKCGDFGLLYTTTTNAYLSGSNGGPL